MVSVGNPWAELESWSGLIAGRTIPHPDAVWKWVPGDCRHTHICACSLAHTTCLSSSPAPSPPLFPCSTASSASFLPFLPPNPAIDGYDSIFISLTHESNVDFSFPNVKSYKPPKTPFLYYPWTLLLVRLEHANINIIFQSYISAKQYGSFHNCMLNFALMWLVLPLCHRWLQLHPLLWRHTAMIKSKNINNYKGSFENRW